MLGRILIALALLIGFCVLVNTVPGQQPGDTPPPMPAVDVFETGLLSASITCDPSVEACSVLVLDVSGTSAGERTLRFAPSVPQAAIYHDSNGQTITVWIRKPGSYGVLWSVSNDEGEAGAGISVLVTAAGDEPPPGPDDPDDDPSPEDAAFMDYIRNLTEEVRADNHGKVAATFRDIAKRIDAGNLQASRAIEAATVRALFGAGGKENKAWRPWWMSLKNHLIHAKALDSDAEWSRHYRLIARAVEDE